MASYLWSQEEKDQKGSWTVKAFLLLFFLFLCGPALPTQAPEGIWQGYGKDCHLESGGDRLAQAFAVFSLKSAGILGPVTLGR